MPRNRSLYNCTELVSETEREFQFSAEFCFSSCLLVSFSGCLVEKSVKYYNQLFLRTKSLSNNVIAHCHILCKIVQPQKDSIYQLFRNLFQNISIFIGVLLKREFHSPSDADNLKCTEIEAGENFATKICKLW